MKSTIIKRAISGEFVLIAEIGVNYYDIANKYGISPIEGAKRMIQEAKNAGIHAVKFQAYKAGTLAVKDSPSYWDTTEEATRSQYELFKKFDSFGCAEYRELADYCGTLNIEFLSTAFDFESADYLNELMNVYKISSSDMTNLPFVEYQARKGKPILLSTGASTEDEIDRTIEVIKAYNDESLVLLHCVLEYPTPYEHVNLNKIVSLKEKYPDLIMGYSDHTKPDDNADVIKTAYTLGALVVEKHFTLDKALPGNDHYHGMDPMDVKKILAGVGFIDRIRGSYGLCYNESESPSRQNARRSIVANCDIHKGQVVTGEMLTFKRPGTGISPAQIEKVVGRVARYEIKEDTILQFQFLV